MTNQYNCETCKNTDCNYYSQRVINRVTWEDKTHSFFVVELTPTAFTRNCGCTLHTDFKGISNV